MRKYDVTRGKHVATVRSNITNISSFRALGFRMLGRLVVNNPRYYPKFEAAASAFLDALRDLNADDGEVRVALGVALAEVCKELAWRATSLVGAVQSLLADDCKEVSRTGLRSEATLLLCESRGSKLRRRNSRSSEERCDELRRHNILQRFIVSPLSSVQLLLSTHFALCYRFMGYVSNVMVASSI